MPTTVYIMYLLGILLWVSAAFAAGLTASTDGIINLVKRRLPDHVDDFEFRLIGNVAEFPLTGQPAIDEYSVSSTLDGKILVEGNSPIALASGWVSSRERLIDRCLRKMQITSIFDRYLAR